MRVGDLVRDTERGDLGLILAVDDTAGFVKVMFSGGAQWLSISKYLEVLCE